MIIRILVSRTHPTPRTKGEVEWVARRAAHCEPIRSAIVSATVL